jgi:glycosyltransferase involved in cell wall biosynthesis
MGALVEAWAGDPVLSASCNLLVVGGDLEEPSRDELAELSRIDAAIARHDGPGRGLLLAGHQPHATVAAWLAAVRHGCAGRSAAGGIYVSASLKEEFGLAILEAMASSLVVVAPDGGGPATYVRGGVTGILTDTTSAAALAAATRRALDLAASPTATERAARELATLRERFSIDTMATALGEVYADASGLRADGRASRPAAKGAAS